jgi:hypothetical protein
VSEHAHDPAADEAAPAPADPAAQHADAHAAHAAGNHPGDPGAHAGHDHAACRSCPRPVDLHADHVTLALQVEREAAGTIHVIESHAVGYLHVECARRGPDGKLLEPAHA